MKKINISIPNVDQLVSEMYDIPFSQVNEHPLVKQLNELSMEYLDKKIIENYGERYIMGSSTGGVRYEMECNHLIDVGEDGEQEIDIHLN